MRFEREIFPFLQSTQWVPLSGPNERERVGGAYDVVFAHGVLDGIRRDAKRFPMDESVGLLVGRGCECPWTRRLWLRVESAVGPEPPRRKGWLRRVPVSADDRPLHERLEELMGREPPAGTRVLGWYRTRHEGAPRLTSEEVALHERRFDEPWQFCVAVPTGTPHPVLGVFGRDEAGSVRPALLRPFYELRQNGSHLRHRPVTPWNYRVVERAERPGSSPVVAGLRERRASALATAACAVIGVGMGLAFSYELSRANQPDGNGAVDTASFGSPLPGLVAARPAEAAPVVEDGTPGREVLDLVRVFEERVRAYDGARERPADATTYCEDLGRAYDGVHAAFVTLLQRRARLDPGRLRTQVETALQAKGRVDANFDATGCRG